MRVSTSFASSLTAAALASVMLVACGSQSSTEQASAPAPAIASIVNIVPAPNANAFITGTLDVSDGVTIIGRDQSVAAQMLTETFTTTGDILVTLQGDTSLTPESYRLVIDDAITISAADDTGLLYGAQTLQQIVLQYGTSLPKTAFTDAPRYSWRGSMIDVARSFYPIDYLYAHVDRMAMFKLNKLHLHLSDDQGWRLQVPDYPRLVEVGGNSAVEGGRTGYYSSEDMRALVEYASERGVTIVPEIDLPGHTQAAIASYNDLACDGVTNLGTYSGVRVGFSKLCLTKPEVYKPFVEAVIDTMVDVFPSEFIHIGGDEIRDPLYGEFMVYASDYVASKGRSAVAWEEAGKHVMNDTSMVFQWWNDNFDLTPAIERGHRQILSPCSYTYLDHGNYAGQPNTYTWCRQDGVPLERLYSFEPADFNNVLGIEAPLWSELVHDNATADNRLWPRLMGVAELGWSVPQYRDWQSFSQRIEALQPMLDEAGVAYYPWIDAR
ncbi:beta-N-acetylhexosaminidase [Salinibius halmophilus]|uniref:beta-N-acetylhexosaminidase n=1 Tax=Salinibius halmophilus TaxID=1853216 RepID=UPI000E66F5EB|nr:family 20 glycosylhydrolase [Salinibius halmophilus]